MESIEKLRDYANEHIINGPLMNAMIDEIEREIDERYMELPVDADGMLWTTDDREFVDPKGERRELLGLEYDINEQRWGLRFIESGFLDTLNPVDCRHVKTDPVKELLRQYRNELEELIQGGFGNVDSLTDDFAARIREAVEK